MYAAVDHEIYCWIPGTAAWVPGYSYPVGTQINVMFYDDLLVGTGTGLYGHSYTGTTGTTSEADYKIPASFILLQNYPNPFNAATRIRFAVPERAHVVLSVYNQLGEKVAELANGVMESGFHTVSWNAPNFTSGVYFYELKTEKFNSVKKLILMK